MRILVFRVLSRHFSYSIVFVEFFFFWRAGVVLVLRKQGSASYDTFDVPVRVPPMKSRANI